jgi:nucleotide-binding universal stress UspA family protein
VRLGPGGPAAEGRESSPARVGREDGAGGVGSKLCDDMEPKKIEKIVVGLDGSDHSAAALGWAIGMARGMQSEVIAVYGIDIPVYFPAPYGVPPQYDPEWRAEMEKEFRGWCAPLEKAGVRFRGLVRDGRPATVLAEVAESEGADVIVVGRRGRGGVAELVLGSVSHELALHSKVPVLLIPPA